MTDLSINNSDHSESSFAYNTKLSDIVTLHGQLLSDMGVRRSYEQFIHVALWGGIGVGTGFALGKDAPDFIGVIFYLLLFSYLVLLIAYSHWVIFISKRQQQNFFESRYLRWVIYRNPDKLYFLSSAQVFPLLEDKYNSDTAIQDPPAYVRIWVTASLLFGSAGLILYNSINKLRLPHGRHEEWFFIISIAVFVIVFWIVYANSKRKEPKEKWKGVSLELCTAEIIRGHACMEHAVIVSLDGSVSLCRKHFSQLKK